MAGIDDLDGRSVSTLRTLNARAVLSHLRSAETPTVSAVARGTGLSRPTVESALSDLMARGLIDEVQPARGSGLGRPARRYRFRAEAGYVIGIDAGPHRLVGVITDLSGKDVHAVTSAGSDLREAAAAASAIEVLARGLLAHVGATTSRLWHLTVGVPGVVDDDGLLWKSVVVPSWVETDVVAMLRDALPETTIEMDNDANLAAIAEFAALDGAPGVNVVSLIVGHRVSSGVIIDGQLHRGHRGTAGEVGALPELGWATAVDSLQAHSPDTPLEETFRREDAESRSAIRQFAEDISMGTAALVLAFGAETVIVGGGIARAGEVFLRPLREALARRCLYTPLVVQAAVGSEAVARGALERSLSSARDRMIDTIM